MNSSITPAVKLVINRIRENPNIFQEVRDGENLFKITNLEEETLFSFLENLKSKLKKKTGPSSKFINNGLDQISKKAIKSLLEKLSMKDVINCSENLEKILHNLRYAFVIDFLLLSSLKLVKESENELIDALNRFKHGRNIFFHFKPITKVELNELIENLDKSLRILCKEANCTYEQDDDDCFSKLKLIEGNFF